MRVCPGTSVSKRRGQRGQVGTGREGVSGLVQGREEWSLKDGLQKERRNQEDR